MVLKYLLFSKGENAKKKIFKKNSYSIKDIYIITNIDIVLISVDATYK